MKSLCLFLAALSLSAATTDEWLAFKLRFGRAYPPEEEHFRRQVFADNLERIKRHNVEFDAGRSTFRLGVNQFADLTNEEFRQKILSEGTLRRTEQVQLVPLFQQLKAARSAPVRSTTNVSSNSIPDSFDWRNSIPFTIEDQGQLGDSWTISVISSVESGLYISGLHGVSLSRQNLLDCVGWPSTVGALEYIRDHGVASEADYPTTGGAGPCRQVPRTAGLDKVHLVAEGDEGALAEGLLLNPAPVMFDASHYSFQLYASGIYSDDSCSSSLLDHALLLVGYGASADTDFWTLANSWGTSWGEGGYVRVERGVNMCGVATMAAYPTGVYLM